MSKVKLWFFIVFLLFGITTPSLADVVPGTSCDPDFLSVMNNRAWMEGRREMEVAQTVILKPDSVLEYSCFQKHAGDLGGESKLTQQPAQRYIDQNFSYIEASGRYTHSGDPCALMYAVWEFSKCNNVQGDIGFLQFDDYINGVDMRPSPAGGCYVTESDRADKWNAAADAVYLPTEELMTPVSAYRPPDMMDIFDPAMCEDLEPIPTGLIVFDSYEINIDDEWRTERTMRPDRFCPAVGCYYKYTRRDMDDEGECVPLPPS